MLRKEQNELLTQTGPGAPMGQMFRSYWLPALLAEELPENDCPPVRVKLMSERLIAFRDLEGRYGLIGRVLRPSRRVAVVRPQRGRRAALPLSRLEIRRDRPVRRSAVGAGPKAASAGKIKLDRLSAGEARRRAVDLYGPADKKPPLPEWEFALVPPEQSFTSKRCRNATGCRPWKAASIRATSPSCIAATSHTDPLFKGAKGNQYNLERHAAGISKSSSSPAACSSARGAMPRTATTTGASRPGSCRASP